MKDWCGLEKVIKRSRSSLGSSLCSTLNSIHKSEGQKYAEVLDGEEVCGFDVD